MKPTSDILDATFAALADPTRRAILARLATGEASVAELAEPFDMTQPAISKHLKVLERAGLISRGREAQRRPRRLEPRPLAEATDWIERYRKIWEGNFKRLDAGLISRGREAQRRPRRLEPRPLAEATDWIERYRKIWEGNFKRLDAVLQEFKHKQKKTIDALLDEGKPKPNKKRRTR